MLQGDLSSNILTDAITHRDTAVFLSQAHKATMVLTGAQRFSRYPLPAQKQSHYTKFNYKNM